MCFDATRLRDTLSPRKPPEQEEEKKAKHGCYQSVLDGSAASCSSALQRRRCPEHHPPPPPKKGWLGGAAGGRIDGDWIGVAAAAAAVGRDSVVAIKRGQTDGGMRTAARRYGALAYTQRYTHTETRERAGKKSIRFCLLPLTPIQTNKNRKTGNAAATKRRQSETLDAPTQKKTVVSKNCVQLGQTNKQTNKQTKTKKTRKWD